MRRAGMVATTLIVASILLASSAFAATRHAVSLTSKEVDVSVTPGPSPQGPPRAVTSLGLLSGTLGTGVIRADIHPLAGNGKYVIFTPRGSLDATVVFTDTPGAAGIVVAGTATVTGGTGAYARAHGTLKLTGLINPKNGNATTHQTGTLTY